MKIQKDFMLFFLLFVFGFSTLNAQLNWLLSPEKGFNECSLISNDYFLLKKEESPYLLYLEGKITKVPYDQIWQFDEEYFKIKKGKLFGLFHPKKGEIIPPVYEKIERLGENLIKVSRYNMFAVVNYRNELIVPYRTNARMSAAGPNIIFTGYYKNLAVFNSNGEKIDLNDATGGKAIGQSRIWLKFGKKTALADMGGKLISEPIYDEIRDFKDQKTTWAKKAGKWGIIDANGKTVIPFEYEQNGNFKDGFTVSKKAGKAVILDEKGNEKFGGKYDQIEIQNDGFSVTVGRKRGCLDESGKEVISPEYFNLGNCNNDLIQAKKGAKDLFGYLDSNGKQVIEPKFERAFAFPKGFNLAAAGKRDSMGLINRKGEFVVEPKHYFVEWYAPLELFRARLNRRADYVYFDKHGQPFDIDYLGDEAQFEGKSEGVILFSNKKGYGFCDESGKVIIEAQFDYAKGFKTGLAIVKKGEFFGVLRKPSQ